MRYDTPVFFQKMQPGEYDPKSGNYAEDHPIETRRDASVTDSGVNTMNLVYGSLKQGSLTIRLQRPYNEPFDKIRIGEKQYRADFSRGQKVFVVSEVQ
jgi:hypothetical protein